MSREFAALKNHFSSAEFYGVKNHLESLSLEVGIKRRLREWENLNPLPEDPHYGILGPSLQWRVFPTQNQAIDWARRDSNLMVFSFESRSLNGPGKRSFLVADPRHYFNVFIRRPLKDRTAYEVIRENTPVKLYFDLEFDKSVNPEICGASLTKVLLKICKFFLRECFDVNCSDDEIIVLDSSTAVKFSNHVIFNLDNVCFKDNHHVGNFVRMISLEISKCHTSRVSSIADVSMSQIDSLFVKDKDDTKLFCDMGVYSRNRNFRLYNATKLGKNTPLVLSKEGSNYDYYRDKEQDLFLDSLVSLTKENSKILSYGENREYSPVKSFTPVSVTHNLKNYKYSPYEELDQYISEKVKPGRIKSWKYFSSNQSIVYSFDNYRFCHNIRREHKSNGVILIANIKKRVWYQKCLDPDCFGFKSCEWSLPDYAFDWLNSSTFDETSVTGAVKNAADDISSEDCQIFNDIGNEWFYEDLHEVSLFSSQQPVDIAPTEEVSSNCEIVPCDKYLRKDVEEFLDDCELDDFASRILGDTNCANSKELMSKSSVPCSNERDSDEFLKISTLPSVKPSKKVDSVLSMNLNLKNPSAASSTNEYSSSFSDDLIEKVNAVVPSTRAVEISNLNCKELKPPSTEDGTVAVPGPEKFFTLPEPLKRRTLFNNDTPTKNPKTSPAVENKKCSITPPSPILRTRFLNKKHCCSTVNHNLKLVKNLFPTKSRCKSTEPTSSPSIQFEAACKSPEPNAPASSTVDDSSSKHLKLGTSPSDCEFKYSAVNKTYVEEFGHWDDYDVS